MRRGSVRGRVVQRIVLAAVASMAVAACDAPAAGSSASTTPPRIATAPLTPTDPTRISAAEAAAIVALGRGSADRPAGGHGHTHGAPVLEVPLFTGDAALFADQWLAAQRSVERVDTIEEIKALGYVRASVPGSGIGTHYVKWSQIALPFDPARPAMLLVDERGDVPVLVGYSYWLQSAQEPVGFAGPNDVWHQHTGLCVVNGWVDREESTGADRCAGTYLAGGDLWMLHAWVVPGFENRDGRFATFNPTLCPPAAGTPDLLRCPT